MTSFKISKDILLDHNSTTFIIAEIGINHEGDFSLAKKMTKDAFDAGANAVKFQIVNADHSYAKETSSYQMFKKVELKKQQYKILFNNFKKRGIVFATPGDLKSVKLCSEINFPLYKISSGLLNNIPLLKEIKKTKKPIIVSTGMAEIIEINKVLSFFKKSKSKLALLHCISLYPTPLKKINLKSINYLKNKYKIITGFSDHTLGWEACKMAVLSGAKIIEKHYTIDSKRKGFDHSISLNKLEFRKMVKDIRHIEEILGLYQKKPLQEELIKKKNMERYCVASKNIKIGEKFSINNILFKRVESSPLFIKAFNFAMIENRKSKYNFAKNQPIIK